MKGERRNLVLAVVAVAALVAAALFAWPYLQPAAGPATELQLVCVASGKKFTLPVDEAAMIPARNPDTGAYTLLPYTRGDDGTVRIEERYRPALAGLTDVNRAVDPETYVVSVQP